MSIDSAQNDFHTFHLLSTPWPPPIEGSRLGEDIPFPVISQSLPPVRYPTGRSYGIPFPQDFFLPYLPWIWKK